MSNLVETLNQVSLDGLRRHIQALEGIRNRIKAPQALQRAEAYIYDYLASLGYLVTRQPFIYDGQEFNNVVASIKGTRFPEENIIALAHFDSEIDTPGANDNASGVAAVLELSRIFRPLGFERSIHYALVNLEERQGEGKMEEIGLLGSRALAAHAVESHSNILGAINFETIACAGDDIPQKAPAGLPIALPEMGNFIAVIGNQASLALVQGYLQAIQRYQLVLPTVPLVVPGNGEVMPDVRRSDHARFWDAGYPAIMLTDTANFRSEHYHHPGDTLETLNLEFCRKVCIAGGGLIAELAGLVDAHG